jgi:hypothetical protein
MDRELFHYFGAAYTYGIAKDFTEGIFKAPCEKDGKCIMPTEAEDRLRGRSPYAPCPKYTNAVKKATAKG